MSLVAEPASKKRAGSARWGEARRALPGEGGRAAFTTREARGVPAIAGERPPLIGDKREGTKR